MLRTFVASLARRPGPAPEDRLTAALAGEGAARVLSRGVLAVAYTGPPVADAGPERPLCLLDGTVYEALGIDTGPLTGEAAERSLADAYARHGEALLDRLRGEFALLLYDPAGERGLIARDHMGGRLMVWHEGAQDTLFATELRPLLRALPRRPAPDPTAVAHWLAVSGMPADHTLYEGVRRVQAGCAVRLGGASVAFRYWDPAPAASLAGGPDENAGALRAALARAVDRRRAPGAEGVLLSGGLDSGAVAALAARRGRPTSYSATFPEHPSVDESQLIDGLTGELGLPNVRIRVRAGSVLGGSLEYLRRWDTPPVSPNLFFWTPLLERAAADGVSVMLDGEGGDELFGYSALLLADRLAHGRLASAVSLVRRMPGNWAGAPPRAVARLLGQYALKGLVGYRVHSAVRRLRGAARYGPAWLRPEIARLYGESDEVHAWKLLAGPRWRRYVLGRVSRGMGAALTYDHVRRRAGMAGIEPRHPLVDVDVIELVLRLPPEAAFEPSHSRPLFRRSLEGLLPDAVRLRPAKSNFDAIFHQSLLGCDLRPLRALLLRPRAEIFAYADPGGVAALLDAPPQRGVGLMWWAIQVWRLVTAECWLMHLDGSEEIERALGEQLRAPEYDIVESGGG
jgi:asparagine synthase (glutamine-hydrolysing)